MRKFSIAVLCLVFMLCVIAQAPAQCPTGNAGANFNFMQRAEYLSGDPGYVAPQQFAPNLIFQSRSTGYNYNGLSARTGFGDRVIFRGRTDVGGAIVVPRNPSITIVENRGLFGLRSRTTRIR